MRSRRNQSTRIPESAKAQFEQLADAIEVACAIHSNPMEALELAMEIVPWAVSYTERNEDEFKATRETWRMVGIATIRQRVQAVVEYLRGLHAAQNLGRELRDGR